MIDHNAVKATTTLLYSDIPQAVDATPTSDPLVIARSLTDRMTSDEVRFVLEQLVAQHVRAAQRIYQAAHQVHDE